MNDETRAGGIWFLGLFGAIELIALAGLGWGSLAFPLPGIPMFGLAVLAYAVGGWQAGKLPDDRRHLVVIVGLAIAMRAVLLPAELRLSDDLWRYLWDGHVGASGINPFLYPPADAALSSVRTAWHNLINNPTVPTIYGPTAQAAFRVIQWLGGTVLSAKVLWVALDLATLGLLVGYARSTSRNGAQVALLYAWSPLLIVETAWSAHLEPLGLLLMVSVIVFMRGKRAIPAGIALAAAAMTKFAPAAVVPILFRRLGGKSLGRDGGWAFLAAGAATVVLGMLPFIAAGRKMGVGLATYAEHWRFHAGAFSVIERAFSDPLHARMTVGVLVVLVIAMATWRRFDAERAFLWVIGAGVVLSPTVHPWYVLWLLPIAALRGSVAWLYLSCSVFLAYWGLDTFHATGEWPEPLGVRAAIWLPFWGLLALEAFRSREDQSVDRQPTVANGE